MNLALIQNNEVVEYPYSFLQLKRSYPNTSFPKIPSSLDGLSKEKKDDIEFLLNEYDVYLVQTTPQPSYDRQTQRIVEGDPILNENGEWVEQWNIEDISQEELDQRLQNKRNSATITPMQLRLILESEGHLDNVEAMMNDPATPKTDRIVWQYASVVERLNPLVLQLAQQFGYTDDQLDQFFGIV